MKKRKARLSMDDLAEISMVLKRWEPLDYLHPRTLARFESCFERAERSADRRRKNRKGGGKNRNAWFTITEVKE